MGRLIGIFGGTFDPPHLGHRILAYEAMLNLGLEQVLWVVTGDPPHKPDIQITPAQDRVAMVEMMIDSEPAFILSRVELDRQPPHYALDTLRLLHQQWPQAELVYLMGSDSLMELPTVWHQPRQFVDQADRLGVMPRPNVELDLPWLASKLPGIESKVTFFTAPLIEISSSLIRSRIRAGQPYKHFVTAEVGRYLDRSTFYRSG
ncbi:MAG: nicotinate-nucleotide adenylyltransferase [Anaerolineales bacterium]|jgi:nicotinate-nucleotide adenylyltransferase